MFNFNLSDITKTNISRIIGFSFNDIVQQDIEGMVSKKITFSRKRDLRKIGRGNPLLARRKIRTLDDVEAKLRRK